MAVNRMTREQFFSAMSGHDDAQLRKALWNLYWRGTADVRRRIETEPAGDIRVASTLPNVGSQIPVERHSTVPSVAAAASDTSMHCTYK